jgi:Uma2 family endonuclease
MITGIDVEQSPMTQAKVRFSNIEEYAALTTSDLPECRFELVDGVIVEMGAENLQNNAIASFLFATLLRFVPSYLLHRGVEVEVTSAYVTCREPDLMVLPAETFDAMQLDKRAIITLAMPNPALVIEVVSPGEPGSDNYKRDYEQKTKEYAARGIPEYWLIDPGRQMMIVLVLKNGQYRGEELRGSDRVVSPAFPDLNLTVEQVLRAGR